MKPDVVLASELGEYVYCKRAWWKSQHGLNPKNVQMVEGQKQHDRLSTSLFLYRIIMFGVVILFIIGILLILLYLLLSFLF